MLRDLPVASRLESSVIVIIFKRSPRTFWEIISGIQFYKFMLLPDHAVF